MQIDISCINTNFSNFWGGEWQASWKVDTQNSTLSGSIKINNHYFENGNIQFSTSQNFSDVPLEGADEENIVKAISKTESNYQSQVEALHAGKLSGVFKAMRRALPVTGTKFNWANPKLVGM